MQDNSQHSTVPSDLPANIAYSTQVNQKRRIQTLASRPILLRRLMDAARYPIVRIIAPAGFGKTTAIRQLLELSTDPVFISVPKTVNAFTDFIRAFAAGCSQLYPTMMTPPDDFPADYTSSQVGELFISWANANLNLSNCTIAIDDIHNADEDERISDFIIRLVDFHKGHMQFILASRTVGRLPHARWEAYGESDSAITPDDLRMTLDDALELAYKIGSQIPSTTIQDWVKQTRGFPVPLTYAIRTSLRNANELEIIRGMRSITFQFLADQCWESLSVENRRCLELAALILPLEIQFLDCIAYGNICQVMMKLCDEISFLTVSHDNELSMHDLFRDFVKVQTDRLGITHRKELRKIAAAILFEAKQASRAFDLLIELRDLEHLMAVIDVHELPKDHQLRGRLVSILEKIPIENRNSASLALSADYWLRSDNAKGIPCAEALLQRTNVKSKHLLSAIRTFVQQQHSLPNFENVDWVERVAPIIRRLDTQDQVEANSFYVYFLARFPRFEFEAKTLISEIMLSIKSFDEISRIDIENRIAIAVFYLGDSLGAARINRDTATTAARIGYQRGLAQALNGLGLMLYVMEDPEFITVSEELRAIVELSGSWSFALTSHWICAQYFARMGDIDQTRKALCYQDSAIVIDNSQRRINEFQRRLSRNFLSLLNENYNAIVSDLARAEEPQLIGSDYRLGAILSLAQAMTGKHIDSQQSLDRTRKQRESYTTFRERSLIRDAFPLEVAAMCANGNWTHAKSRLRENTDLLSTKSNLYRALQILADGPPFNQINEALVGALGTPFHGLAALLIERISAFSLRPDLGSLTSAEIEVLRLVSLGKSNKEIALARSRSPETIKRQVTSIYRKLGVGSRVHAAAVAHDRGLLQAL